MIKPLSDISGRTALPASVISPNRSILRHLSLLSSDQLLRGFRGQSFWAVMSAAIFFVVLSIQPKHRASSTASMYQKVLLSVGLPRFTTTQHSFSVLWFCISHSRSSVLDLTSSKFHCLLFQFAFYNVGFPVRWIRRLLPEKPCLSIMNVRHKEYFVWNIHKVGVWKHILKNTLFGTFTK